MNNSFLKTVSRLIMSATCAVVVAVEPVTAAQRDLAENSSIVSADGTGDYTSLKAAAQALTGSFSSVPDHTLYIASDLVESEPVVFDRNSGTSKLIIKPLGAPRTITVTSQSSQGAWQPLSGISFNWPNRFDNKTCNVVIDGSLENVEEPGLNFVFHHDEQTTPISAPHYGFAFGGYGSVDMRNCRIEHNPGTDQNSFAVLIETRIQRPVRLIDNIIKATFGTGSGVLIDLAGNQPGAADVIISGNSITAENHGVAVYNRDATIEKNAIEIDADSGSMGSLIGILVNRNVSPTTTTVISQNYVLLTGGNSQLVAQGIRAYSGIDHGGTLLIHNNMVSLNLDTGNESRVIKGITTANRRGALSEVAHNSIFLPGNQTNSEELGRNFHGLGLDGASSNTVTLANNIIRVGTRWASALYVAPGNPLVSDGNVFGVAGDAVAVASDSTTHTLLADWQTASGLDGDSQALDPLSMWGSPEDLHLVNATAGLKPGIVDILQAPLQVDFDGDVRNATVPTPGADEADMAAGVRGWSLYGEQ